MIPKPIADITESDILIAREGKTLDFKRQLPGRTDDDKKEFLADVSSFGNTSGGDLIFGVDEEEGAATGIPGLSGIDLDAEILRLDGIAQTGLEPRLPRIEMERVPLPGGRQILLVRIGPSYLAPHRVKANSKFFARNSRGKYLLDVGELRRAFLASEGQADRIRRFREDRLAKIAAGETPVPLVAGAIMVTHLVPLASVGSTPPELDLSRRDLTNLVPPVPHGSFTARFNLDGIVNQRPVVDGKSHGYASIFRNGEIETVTVHTLDTGIHAVGYEDWLLRGLADQLGFYKATRLEPPAYLFLTFLNVRDVAFQVSKFYVGIEPQPIDRNDLILPEIVIDDFGAAPSTLLRPAFDRVWNAWGFEGCYNYDESGNRKPGR